MTIPVGWFHRTAQQEEEELVTKGQVVQFFPIVFQPNMNGIQGPINISGNGLQLLNRISQSRDGGNPITGSTTARVMVRINREDAPWIPFSFIANSGDAQTIAATIGKIWFNITTPDAVNPIIFLVVNNAGVGCVGGGNTIGSYSVPAGNQGPVFGGHGGNNYGASPAAVSNVRRAPGPAPNVAGGGSGSSGRAIAAVRP